MSIILHHSWPFWGAGIAIGLLVVLLAWVTGKALGVSAGYGTLPRTKRCDAYRHGASALAGGMGADDPAATWRNGESGRFSDCAGV